MNKSILFVFLIFFGLNVTYYLIIRSDMLNLVENNNREISNLIKTKMEGIKPPTLDKRKNT